MTESSGIATVRERDARGGDRRPARGRVAIHEPALESEDEQDRPPPAAGRLDVFA